MNVHTLFSQADAAEGRAEPDLLAQAAAPFAPLAETFGALAGAVDEVASVGGRSTAAQTRKLARTLRKAEPGVTMIGQVKSGKTSLINAMIGAPGLLPADVNPWTSVVTSLHLSPTPAGDGTEAVFRFFEADQWDRLMRNGGRIGELAGRAGADDEMARVAQQLEEMRRKSKRRLGDHFELLMGQAHRYGHVDPDLIQRYVCFGDDPGLDDGVEPAQGRFADITRSADLYLHRPGFPIGLCITDTPGVNDTFLMREQITVQAIRESRTCVVVLSAHQAMSTVDMALVRLIANIPSRDVVIFVNRIDELSDAGAHVAEIDASIRKTIETHHGPTDARILFGSAYWAGHALEGTLDEMDKDSAAALVAWAEAELGDLPRGDDGRFLPETAWELSGIPALYAALAERIQETSGAEIADRVARTGHNIASTLETTLSPQVRPRIGPARGGTATPAERLALPAELDRLEQRQLDRLDAAFAPIIDDFHRRLDRAQAGFVDRAVASLVAHLDTQGDSAGWAYDPTGLRVLLRTAFKVFSKRARAASTEVYRETGDAIADLCVRAFDLDPDSFAIEPPTPPAPQPPVILGETIALDLNAGWWSRWWKRRRGWQAFAGDLADLLDGECGHMVDAVRAEYGEADHARARAALGEFVEAQRKTLGDLWMRDGIDAADMRQSGIGTSTAEKGAALASAKRTFAKYMARGTEEAA